jgi:hypothetical protein
MQFVVKFLALKLELKQGQWIDDLLRDLPDNFHGPLGVNNIESK